MRVSDLVKSFEEQIALSPKSLSPRSSTTFRHDDITPKARHAVKQQQQEAPRDEEEEEVKFDGRSYTSNERNSEVWDDATEQTASQEHFDQETTHHQHHHQESRDEHSIDNVMISPTSELTEEFYVEEAHIIQLPPVEHHHRQHHGELLHVQELLSEPDLLESNSDGTEVNTKYTELTDERRGNEIHLIGTEIASPHAQHLSESEKNSENDDEASLHTCSSELTDEVLPIETQNKITPRVRNQATQFDFDQGEEQESILTDNHAQSRDDSEQMAKQDVAPLCEAECKINDPVVSTPNQSDQELSWERDSLGHFDQKLLVESEHHSSLESRNRQVVTRESRDVDDIVALVSGNREEITLETRELDDGIVRSGDGDRVDIKQLFHEMEQSMEVRFRRLEETCNQIPLIMEQLQQHVNETKFIATSEAVLLEQTRHSQEQQQEKQEQDTTRLAIIPRTALNIMPTESNITEASFMASFPELQAFVNQLETTTADAIADALEEEEKPTCLIDSAVEGIPSDEERDDSSPDQEESSIRFIQQMSINASTQSSAEEDASLPTRETESNDDDDEDETSKNSNAVLAFACPGMTAIELFPFDPAKDMEQLTTFLEEQHMMLHKACVTEMPCCGHDTPDIRQAS